MCIIKTETQHFVAFPDGAAIGQVNAQLDQVLTSIAEQGYDLDFEVFVPTKAIQETLSRAERATEAVVRVQVNVYGPPTAAHNIGRELSQQNLYLQHPAHVRDSCRYQNPHILTLPGFHFSTSETAIPAEETVLEKPSIQTLKSTLQDVYLSLTRGHNLRGLEGDERLNTPLLLYVTTSLQNTDHTPLAGTGGSKAAY